MPRKNLDDHFEEERPEWTRRKHSLLAGYVIAAAMKMRLKGTDSIVLVDGYAGANSYGTEATGSTVIMVNAAKRALSQNAAATVYACEPDPGRYKLMCANLAADIESGVLIPFNESHSEALPKILAGIRDAPAVVFLDPHTVTQMTLEGDIMPWVKRANTDVLGVFMAGQACRCCGQALKGTNQQIGPEMYMGNQWKDGNSEEGAFNSFFAALGNHKRFKGMYRLRKLEPLRYAYGIFGLSDHPDGYWLLSNAVAKDNGLLADFDYRKDKETSLFADSDREDKQQEAFDLLVNLSAPTIRENTGLRGADLASYLFDEGIGVEELFGKFEERDFTTAVYHVLGLPDRRGHAKAKRD